MAVDQKPLVVLPLARKIDCLALGADHSRPRGNVTHRITLGAPSASTRGAGKPIPPSQRPQGAHFGNWSVDET